jgi:MFS family permease
VPQSSAEVIARNFRLNLIEGAIYISSGALFSMQTVLPALVARLGGSNVQIAAVAVVGYACLFLPQIFSARFAEAAPFKRTMTVGLGAVQRVVLLSLACVLLIWGRSAPGTVLVLFFMLYGLNMVIVGVTTPFWYDFYAKLTPVHRRGRLFGLRTSFGALGSIGCGVLLTWLLGALPFPMNFGAAILIASGLQFVSLWAQASVREEFPSEVRPRAELVPYLKSLPSFFRHDRSFVPFIAACALFVVGGIPVGFYAAYALRHLAAPEQMVGGFTVAIVTIQVASATINGMLADRVGYKIPLMIAGIALASASITAVFAPTALWFYAVFILAGINIGTEGMARANMAMEFGAEHRRASVVGLLNTLLAPFYILGLLGGLTVDLAGFTPLFIIGACCAIVGVLVMMFFVTDPRAGKRQGQTLTDTNA